MALMLVCFTGCDDKKVNKVKHDTEITITEEFQNYETLGYYVAENKSGQTDKILTLRAEVIDLITGKTVKNPKLEWRVEGGGAGIGSFYVQMVSNFATYNPVLDSAPTTLLAYVYYDGDSNYLGSVKPFTIKQNY